MKTQCLKCSGTSFEVALLEPKGANYKVYAVQCSVCGTSIGVLEYFNSGALLGRLEKRISSLESSLSDIGQKVYNIENILRQSR